MEPHLSAPANLAKRTLDTISEERFEFHPGHELVRLIQRERETGVVSDTVRVENGPDSGWSAPTGQLMDWLAATGADPDGREVMVGWANPDWHPDGR